MRSGGLVICSVEFEETGLRRKREKKLSKMLGEKTASLAVHLNAKTPSSISNFVMHFCEVLLSCGLLSEL